MNVFAINATDPSGCVVRSAVSDFQARERGASTYSTFVVDQHFVKAVVINLATMFEKNGKDLRNACVAMKDFLAMCCQIVEGAPSVFARTLRDEVRGGFILAQCAFPDNLPKPSDVCT